jgi:hypothetical protein
MTWRLFRAFLALPLLAFDWAGRLLFWWHWLAAFVELLERGWCAVFPVRPLRNDEMAASLEVHGPGRIPYQDVRVDDTSLLCRINGRRAVATRYLVHYAAGRADLATAVHELSHVAQYAQHGPIIMPQALYAQVLGGGYDYGDLARARLAGKRFRNFNREQQAQICDDYYRALHGLTTRFGATLADLQPYVDDMRRVGF